MPLWHPHLVMTGVDSWGHHALECFPRARPNLSICIYQNRSITLSLLSCDIDNPIDGSALGEMDLARVGIPLHLQVIAANGDAKSDNNETAG